MTTRDATDTAMTADVVAPIRVLIADDEVHLGAILEQYLSARGCAVTLVRDGRAALDRLLAEQFDVALLDVVMPEVDGLEVLRRVREESLPPEILIVTGNGTIETTLAALKLGAYDCVSKPYRMAEVEALVRRAFEKRMLLRDNHVLQALDRRSQAAPEILTQFAPLIAVRSLLLRLSPSTSCVLISGDAGTGKHHVARFIHAHSHRATGAFVAIDCARDNAQALLEPVGLLSLADGGTLYLANVEQLSLDVQDALEQTLLRSADARKSDAQHVRIDARVLASTADDWSRVVASGSVRPTFAHRLETIRVTLPPLRDRSTDIGLLADHFLEMQSGSRRRQFSTDALDTLERYAWPGNVSELKSVVERAAMLATDGEISARALALDLANVHGHAHTQAWSGARDVMSSAMTLAELERQHIAEVLARTQWHQGRASEILGISPKTLYRKIREFGFKRP